GSGFHNGDRTPRRQLMSVRVAALAAVHVTVAALLAQPALAADSKLPETLAWSAYDVCSAGHSQAAGLGAALNDQYGPNLRILPGKNDVSRMLPLKTNRLDFVANGAGTYMAQEGMYEFGGKEWGPLPVRILVANIAPQSMSVIVAKDTGAKTVADLMGKRGSWVIGAPATNQNITAVLSFAGLTCDAVATAELCCQLASC